MIKLISRKLFFSVPSLSKLQEEDKAKKMQEISENYAKSYSKEHQRKIRARGNTFSYGQKVKIRLILEQLLQMNTFEIMHMRRLLQSNQELEYNWPVTPRLNESLGKIPQGTIVPGLGPIKSSLDLVEKLTVGSSDKSKEQEVEEKPKEVIVEKTTFNLVLTGFDPATKVKFIKAIKDAMGLGLKESKDKVEEVLKGPVVLFKGVSKDSHGKILEQLKAAGGQVEFQ